MQGMEVYMHNASILLYHLFVMDYILHLQISSLTFMSVTSTLLYVLAERINLVTKQALSFYHQFKYIKTSP